MLDRHAAGRIKEAAVIWSPMGRPAPSRAGLLAVVVGLVVVALMSSTVVARGKPGYPTRISWSGADWQIKTSRSPVGPGPNVFSAANVSVDRDGFLHLRIQQDGGIWTCAEIIGPTSFGYGTYTWIVNSSLAGFDPNVVLGLFTWSDRARYAHREIDIEVAAWGDPTSATNAQVVVQPWDADGHLVRFNQPANVRTSQQFTWAPGSITWVVNRLDSGAEVFRHTYTGTDVPKPGDERVRLNLWLFNGTAPAAPAEVVVESFSFTP